MQTINQSPSKDSSSILDLTALQLADAIRNRRISAVEATQECTNNIKIKNKLNNSYISYDEENAIKHAQRVQAQIEQGKITSPLAGVPIAVKDNLCTKGMRTTCGSKMLEKFVPPYSATAIEKAEDAGIIILGKTNMDEFAMGSTTETSYFGPTRNPYDKNRVAGGSSGGSAAAVKENTCYLSLGSDTGGSIRQPASHCGVVGIKPTYGTVSRYGLVAYASDMDQIGPIGKDVADCVAMLEVIAGKDERDATSIDRRNNGGYNFTEALVDDVKGMKIGIPKEYLDKGIQNEVCNAILQAARELEKAGAKVEEFSLGKMEYVIPTYYILADAQASSNLERFDGVKYGYRAEQYENLNDLYKRSRGQGFGEEVKRRILTGTFVLSEGYYDAYYLKALQVKEEIRKAFDKSFETYDVIWGPVAPTTAPLLGESLANPLKMYLEDIYTVAVNLAGLPAMSLPCGIDQNGLPIGLQLIANRLEEKKMIRAAYSYEQLNKKI